MKALLTTSLAILLAAASCTREKEPAQPSAVSPPEKGTAVKRVAGKKTMFERSERERNCESDPASCDGEKLQMDIKKSVEKEIDPQSELSTEFCLGGCSKKSIVNWSLEWK